MSILDTKVRAKVARAFVPLMAPRRYKGAFGGRGGAKSHFFAEQVVLRCFTRETRVVCIREIQKSLADSVRQLLVDKIASLGLGAYFTILETEIRGHNGSIIIFRGMQSFNAETIKSLEGYDIAWVEEAQTLSEYSLRMLRPTLRKEGSELWFSWNPRHRTDPVDVFFRKRPLPPDQMVSVWANWRDNPWFPEVLDKDRIADMIADPEQAEHVWEGGYGVTQGAILARLVDRAEREGRIHDEVDFDPRGPGIEITSDIGFRDTATWWFWQRRLGGFVLVDAMGDSGVDADDWAVVLSARCRDRGYRLDKIWLPKDAKARTMASKHSVQDRFRKFFGPAMVKIVPKTSVADRINAGRTIVRVCHFHKTNCEAALEGLRAWQFEYNPETEAFSREPLHNWACFVADTLVATPVGPRVIEALRAGDLVSTPAGPRAITAVHTYHATRLAEIVTADGRRVTCTQNHKFFTARGLVPADGLSYGDVLFTGRESLWRLVSWISTAAGTIGIHRAISELSRQGSGSMSMGSGAGLFIATFMKRLAAPFRLATKSTTKTSTPVTTTSTIWSASPWPPTKPCTAPPMDGSQRPGTAASRVRSGILKTRSEIGNGAEPRTLHMRTAPSKKHASAPQSGTAVMPGAPGTARTANASGRNEKLSAILARYAIRLLLRIGRAQSTAGRIVGLRHFDADMPVYDLTVERDHCFMAGGILTSNSHWGDGFSYGAQVMQGLEPEPEDVEPNEIGPNTHTIMDLMKSQPRKSRRV